MSTEEKCLRHMLTYRAQASALLVEHLESVSKFFSDLRKHLLGAEQRLVQYPRNWRVESVVLADAGICRDSDEHIGLKLDLLFRTSPMVVHHIGLSVTYPIHFETRRADYTAESFQVWERNERGRTVVDAYAVLI